MGPASTLPCASMVRTEQVSSASSVTVPGRPSRSNGCTPPRLHRITQTAARSGGPGQRFEHVATVEAAGVSCGTSAMRRVLAPFGRRPRLPVRIGASSERGSARIRPLPQVKPALSSSSRGQAVSPPATFIGPPKKRPLPTRGRGHGGGGSRTRVRDWIRQSRYVRRSPIGLVPRRPAIGLLWDQLPKVSPSAGQRDRKASPNLRRLRSRLRRAALETGLR